MSQRFRQWRYDGTFDRVLTRLHLRLREDGLVDLDTWMVDSTAIRATRSASGAGKKRGAVEPLDHALGRSHGGLSTKIHLLCDSLGFLLTFSLSADQRADSAYLTELLEKVRLPDRSGRPHKRGRYIVADKDYDSDALRRYCTRCGMRPITPQHRMHRRPSLSLPHQFDRPKYRQRTVVERLFGWLKEKASIKYSLWQVCQ